MSVRSCVTLVLTAILLTACGAAEQPPGPAPTPQVSSAPPTAIPGLTLRQLGFENGPLDEFRLPVDAVITTRVDQPNVVTVVLARPSPQTVQEFLGATLPLEGFMIDAQATGAAAMTFAGNGWTGGFTGTAGTSAIVLRPA